MALIDKLTAIANAIRAKTGSSNTMTLTEMATAIGTLSENCQCFLKTVPSNQSAMFSLLAADATLAAHRNDGSLFAGFLALSDISAANPSMKCGVNTNQILYDNGSGTTLTGIAMRSNATNVASFYIKYPLNAADYNIADNLNPEIGVTVRGGITVKPTSATPFVAGTYLVFYGWGEE